MAEVDAVGGSARVAAYAPPDPLDRAREVLTRREDGNPALLLLDATRTAKDLEGLANPTAQQTAALEQVHALIEKLSPPAVDAEPAAPKTWVASGAARSRPTSPETPVAIAKAAAKASSPAQVVKAAPKFVGPPEPVAVDAPSGTAQINSPMTLKELAANAFGITAAEVGDTHLALLTQGNESLAKLAPGAKIAPGTTVSLSASPRVADLQRKAVVKGLETIDALLAETRNAKPGSAQSMSAEAVVELGKERARLVDEGKALQTQLPNLRSYDAIGRSEAQRNKAIDALTAGDSAKAAPLLAGARKELDQALAAKDLPSGAQAALLKRRGDLSLLEASAASASSAALNAFREKNGTKKVGALTELPPDVQDATKKVLGSVGDSFKKARADLQASAAAYRAQAKVAPPEDQPRLTAAAKQGDLELAGLTGREQSALGAVHASVGNSAGQLESLRKELDAVMPGGGTLLATTVEKHVTDDGKTASALSWLGSNKVGVMKPQAEQAFTDRLSKLSPEQQSKALAVVAKYGEAGATNGDLTAINTSRQVLERRTLTDSKGPWSSQASLIKGSYLLQLGNPKGATEAFREAQTKAEGISDPATKKSTLTRAVLGEASSLSANTREGSTSEKLEAATSLRTLRQKEEGRKPPLLDRSSLAQVTLSEVTGFLGPNKAKEADASLAYLKKTYGGAGADGKPELQWLDHSLQNFEAQNREGGAAAFAQVLMSEAEGRQSGTTKLAVVGAGIATGAAAGFFGGGIGAIPGALIGGGVAGLGLLTANVAMGMGNAWQAGQTGLARQSWVETLTDGVGVVTDVIGAAAPLKGMALVGQAGMRAAVGGLDEASMAAVKSSALAVERQFGSEAFAKLTPAAQEDAARKMLMKDFSNSSLRVGGAVMLGAGVTAAAAGVAKGLVDINNDTSMTAAQRAAARTKLFEGIGKALITSAPQVLMQMAIHQSATAGLSADLRKAVTAAAAAKSSVVRLEESDFRAKLKGAADDEIKAKGLTGSEAEAVRAHYAGIEKNGEAFIDLGTGNAYVNKAVPDAKVAEVLRHEVAHRSFHELPFEQRKKLIDTFNSNPAEAAKMRAAVAAENPHAGGFSPLQVIDEYQAMVRAQAESAKGLHSGIAPAFDKALETAGLQGVKELDTAKFLKEGKLDLGQFRSRSGERLGMGASNLGEDKLKALAAIGRDYSPLGRLLPYKDAPEVKAKLARLNPQRMQEMSDKNSTDWGAVFANNKPEAASKALMSALESEFPDALKALLTQKPAAVAGAPVAAPVAAAAPPVATARPATAAATAAPAARPAAPAAPAAPVGPTAEAKASIEALGFAAGPLRSALGKASPEEVVQLGAFAKALKSTAETLGLDKTKMADAFAKADDAGKTALTSMLDDAAAARAGVKAMGGVGTSSMNSAIEAAFKSANPEAMKSLASLTSSLSTKLDSGTKEAVAKAARSAVEAGDVGALKNLAANVEKLKDPAAAARFANTIKLASDGSRIGEILAQPNAAKVSALRVLAGRATSTGTELDVAKLAKATGAHAQVAEFLANEATPELLNRLVSSTAAGKSDTEQLMHGLSKRLFDPDTVVLLREVNKHEAATLEKFTQYLGTAEDMGSLRDTTERMKYVNYRMARDASDASAPTGLHLGGPQHEWKLGQPVESSVNLAKMFNAEGASTGHAAYRLMAQLTNLRNASNPAAAQKALKDVHTELISLNTEAAVRTNASPELKAKFVQLEAQVASLLSIKNPTDQWRALRALSN